jgi:hypothetical protein
VHDREITTTGAEGHGLVSCEVPRTAGHVPAGVGGVVCCRWRYSGSERRAFNPANRDALPAVAARLSGMAEGKKRRAAPVAPFALARRLHGCFCKRRDRKGDGCVSDRGRDFASLPT